MKSFIRILAITALTFSYSIPPVHSQEQNTYNIEIITGRINNDNAKTTDAVFLKIYGANGSSSDIQLSSRNDRLMEGKTKNISAKINDLGELSAIQLKIEDDDGRGRIDGWFAERINIQDTKRNTFWGTDLKHWFDDDPDPKRTLSLNKPLEYLGPELNNKSLLNFSIVSVKGAPEKSKKIENLNVTSTTNETDEAADNSGKGKVKWIDYGAELIIGMVLAIFGWFLAQKMYRKKFPPVKWLTGKDVIEKYEISGHELYLHIEEGLPVYDENTDIFYKDVKPMDLEEMWVRIGSNKAEFIEHDLLGFLFKREDISNYIKGNRISNIFLQRTRSPRC